MTSPVTVQDDEVERASTLDRIGSDRPSDGRPGLSDFAMIAWRNEKTGCRDGDSMVNADPLRGDLREVKRDVQMGIYDSFVEYRFRLLLELDVKN